MSTLWSAPFSHKSVDRAVLSPNCRRLALSVDAALFLIDVDSGETNELEAPANCSSIIWVGDDSLCIGNPPIFCKLKGLFLR